MRASIALIVVAILLTPALRAQKVLEVPRRPRLFPGADTNDARTFYQYGVQMIDSKPEESSRAFYWASRIDPSSGEALYAMRTAALMQMSGSGLIDYFDYASSKRKPEYLTLDSLLYRAVDSRHAMSASTTRRGSAGSCRA